MSEAISDTRKKARTPGRKAAAATIDTAVSRPLALADAAPVQPEGGAEHLELRLWLRLLSCTAKIENILKSKLRQEFGTTLARFDILSALDRFPDGLTMTEVSRRLMVSNGATTGLVDRLVQEGLALREDHPDDRRTVIVRISPAGRDLFRRMAQRHEEWLISILGDLSGPAQTDLLRALTLLKRRLDQTST